MNFRELRQRELRRTTLPRTRVNRGQKGQAHRRLAPWTVEALKSHRKRQLEDQLRAGVQWADYGLVFATRTDTPYDYQTVTSRHYKPPLKRADLPDIRFHDLRHTYATLLLARGTHPTYVQKSLGHANIAMILDRYSHWMPSMGRATADAIDAALG
jgi:integrase